MTRGVAHRVGRTRQLDRAHDAPLRRFGGFVQELAKLGVREMGLLSLGAVSVGPACRLVDTERGPHHKTPQTPQLRRALS